MADAKRKSVGAFLQPLAIGKILVYISLKLCYNIIVGCYRPNNIISEGWMMKMNNNKIMIMTSVCDTKYEIDGIKADIILEAFSYRKKHDRDYVPSMNVIISIQEITQDALTVINSYTVWDEIADCLKYMIATYKSHYMFTAAQYKATDNLLTKYINDLYIDEIDKLMYEIDTDSDSHNTIVFAESLTANFNELNTDGFESLPVTLTLADGTSMWLEVSNMNTFNNLLETIAGDYKASTGKNITTVCNCNYMC